MSTIPRLASSIRRHWPLLLALSLALVLRITLWDNLPRTGMISDEAEYLAAADWLAHGRGFAWHQGWLWTRAPLYPLFLAAHVRLFGLQLPPIYLTQTGLSLVNVALVYVLALHIGPELATGEQRARGRSVSAAVASLLMAVYLPFAAYPQLLLSETLYLTLLLGAFVCLAFWARSGRSTGPSVALIALAGVLLGLATLTRGLTLGFLPLVAVWILAVRVPKLIGGAQQSKIQNLASKIGNVLVFVACTAFVILPWSAYASRTYGGPILIDTTGAYNLLLGARTAYDGTRRDAPPRNFVLAFLDPRLAPEERRALLADSCLYRRQDPRVLAALDLPVSEITQGQRQQLMTAEGLCLLRAAPGAFIGKSLRELVDLFQINYTGAERLTDGFALGRLPPWYAASLFLLDDTLYVLALPLAIIGWALAWTTDDGSPHRRGRTTVNTLIGLWWLYNLATAPLLFAINRFRLPLLPFAFIFAAYALVMLLDRRPPRAGQSRGRPGRWSLVLALVLTTIATTPYAYLQAPPSSWASYLGPYPSSLASTIIAWQTRPGYLRAQAVQAALGRGDAAAARAVLVTGAVPPYVEAVAHPLLAGLEGDPAAGLVLLDRQEIAPLAGWQTTVVRGELLRRLGEWEAARVVLSPTEVDRQNPVEWAWRWLYPPPLPDQRIDLGGDLDLGYIRGFYLGEGAPDIDGTVRWSGPEAQLRFPAAGSGGEQQICLRADGRGWPGDLPRPQFRLLLDEQTFATIDLQRAGVEIYCATLPPAPPGADVIVTLRSDTFVPNAADLLGQQEAQVGQLRLLGVRLDWAEIR